MKKYWFVFLLILNVSATKSQDYMSTYNLSKNSISADELFPDDRKQKNHTYRKGINKTGKILIYTGVLVGGLAMADYASQQDYFVGNSMIYGAGGILTIIATGIVISSVNGINKQLYFSVKKEGLTMNLAIR